jgi:hypothetical protein
MLCLIMKAIALRTTNLNWSIDMKCCPFKKATPLTIAGDADDEEDEEAKKRWTICDRTTIDRADTTVDSGIVY